MSSKSRAFFERLTESGSPVKLIGEDFTVKIIHTQYYKRDDYHCGIADKSQTIFNQTLDKVDIAAISKLINQ